MIKKTFIALIFLGYFSSVVHAQSQAIKTGPAPEAYGRVTMKRSVASPGETAPTVFDHWVHRSKFTCRLCHADIGFEMRAGSTSISSADNMQGRYCGTCHNGKMKYNGKPVFPACAKDLTKKDAERCEKCHAPKKDAGRETEFYRLAGKMPTDRFGNGINWEKAEAEGLITLVDSLKSVPKKKETIAARKDLTQKSKLAGVPDVIFSHQKHVVWNGCEMCHPDVFNINKGTTKYSMIEISAGLYCGACHDKVAFPIKDCQKCHVKPFDF